LEIQANKVGIDFNDKTMTHTNIENEIRNKIPESKST
jgi:hypothetical protein